MSSRAESQGAMFRGDAWHSGIYESSTSPSLEEVVWKFKTKARVVSSPLVVSPGPRRVPSRIEWRTLCRKH